MSFLFTVLVFFPLFYVLTDLLFVVSVFVSSFLLAVIFCFLLFIYLFFLKKRFFETGCYITQAGLKLAM